MVWQPTNLCSLADALSNNFTIDNGVRRGAILSLVLFALYTHDLLHCISLQESYFSTWAALQLLLNRLLKQCIDSDMTCIFKKTVCMVLTHKRRENILSRSFPRL